MQMHIKIIKTSLLGIAVLLVTYGVFAWQVLNRLTALDLTYLYVSDVPLKHSITPYPIIRPVKQLYWSFLDGNERVYLRQEKKGDVFILLMNLEDDAKYTKDIVFNRVVLARLQKDMYCLGLDDARKDKYMDYAIANKNPTMLGFLKKEKTGAERICF